MIPFKGCMDEEMLEVLLYDPLLALFEENPQTQIPLFARYESSSYDPQYILE